MQRLQDLQDILCSQVADSPLGKQERERPHSSVMLLLRYGQELLRAEKGGPNSESMSCKF